MKKLTLIFTVPFYFTFLFSSLFAQQKDILWTEDFEGDWTQNWYVDNGTWEVGVPTSGPNSAHEGVKCAATVLEGNYPDNEESRLIRFTWFTVPSADENPRLRFYHWYSFNTDAFDHGRVQIKTQASNTWVDVSNSFSGTGSNAWSNVAIDLIPYADSVIQIGFLFHSQMYGSGSDVGPGWYIDDIELRTGPIVFNNPEDWETGINDWWVSDGTWEVGAPTSGPDTVPSGQYCLATQLAGDYSDYADDSHCISPWITVPPTAENPRLRFYHWYSFNTDAFDHGKVQIRTQTSNTWVDVSNAFSGTGSNVWSNVAIDLTPYADSVIQIGFFFHSQMYGSGSDTGPGWYIDDIELRTGPIVFNNPEDWETGINDWWVSDGTWEVGTPTSGPDTVYSGQYCIATHLDGNYSDYADDSRFISPWITVPPATENPRLRFYHWYSFNTDAFDHGKVQIRTQTSNTWVDVSNTFSGTGSNAWSNVAIDLIPYADSVIQIGFFFHSQMYGSGSDVGPGWYIDDIELRKGPIVFNNPEDWETGIDDWWVSDGTWEVGIPGSGPDSAYSGQYCVATHLGGNYSDYADDSHFISPWLTVPSAAVNPRLRFWHWFSFNTDAFDHGKVQIRTQTTNNWVDVSEEFSGSSGGIWSYMYIDLLPYADSVIQIGFYFHSQMYGSGSDVGPGWYIDDLIIDDDSDLGVDAGPDITINYGASATLEAAVTGGTPPYFFEWVPAEGLDDPSALNPVASPVDSTIFTLTVTDDHGSFRTDHVRVNVVLGTSILDNDLGDEVKVYPNPFRAKTTLEFNNPDDSNYTLALFNLSGKKVYEKVNITNSRVELVCGLLEKGIYIFELVGKKKLNGKIVIK